MHPTRWTCQASNSWNLEHRENMLCGSVLAPLGQMFFFHNSLVLKGPLWSNNKSPFTANLLVDRQTLWNIYTFYAACLGITGHLCWTLNPVDASSQCVNVVVVATAGVIVVWWASGCFLCVFLLFSRPSLPGGLGSQIVYFQPNGRRRGAPSFPLSRCLKLGRGWVCRC